MDRALESRPAAAVRPTPDLWIDEGPVRNAATRAVRRGAVAEPAARPKPAAKAGGTKPVGIEVKVAEASRALDRERFGEVKRILQPVVRLHPELASAHELLGLASYRLGEWRKAITELEAFRTLGGGVEHLPVLMDCYRALKRYPAIEPLWAELREASPSAAIVAEGRIVMAGSLADRGKVEEAIDVMSGSDRVPSRVREHHLRLWYVLADLYDRSGEATKARALFQRIRTHDGDFADVNVRLANLV